MKDIEASCGPELSVNEKKIIKKIERLPLSDHNKAVLLLTWRGLKPVSLIDVPLPGDFSESGRRLTAKLQIFFKRIGLHSLYQEKPNQNKVLQYIFVSRDQQLTNRSSALQGVWKEVYEEEMGRLLGYSFTAAKAYRLSREADKRGEVRTKNSPSFLWHEIPQNIREQDYMAFCWFAPSREHLTEDLKTVKQWAEEIRRLSPVLYQRIIDNYRD